MESLKLWYWNKYYEYGALYDFWNYLFPVAGRKKTMFCGNERLFRPLRNIRREWYEIQASRSRKSLGIKDKP